VVVKTTRITIETENLLVVRRGKTIVTWCPACCADVEVMTLEGDSLGEDIPSSYLRTGSNRQAASLASRRRFSSNLPPVAAAVLRSRVRSQAR
jgi:hypothetical protein